MKKHVHHKEFDQYMDQWSEGMKHQQRITMKVKDNYLVKETVTRVFFKNGEYIDSFSSETICNASK
jgi:hypothetical protein